MNISKLYDLHEKRFYGNDDIYKKFIMLLYEMTLKRIETQLLFIKKVLLNVNNKIGFDYCIFD